MYTGASLGVPVTSEIVLFVLILFSIFLDFPLQTGIDKVFWPSLWGIWKKVVQRNLLSSTKMKVLFREFLLIA